MRSSIVTLTVCSLLLAACNRQSSSGPSVLQVRLVQESATADTEPLTIDVLLTDPTSNTSETLNVRKEVLLDQSAVSSATVQTQGLSHTPMVEVVLTEKGRNAFADITRQNIGRRLAIVVDGRLLVAPRIEAEVPGGRALITGRLTAQQASGLASKINDGVKK